MVAWKSELKPLEMAQVASYVLQFQGTTPAEPKAAEGDIWVEEGVKIDTTNTNENSQEPNETTVDITKTVEAVVTNN